MTVMHTETPLLESLPLSRSSDSRVRSGNNRVWLKMEALQPTGSFKIRGIGHTCATLAQQGARRFISSSGGNAGIAVAYAGRKLQVPVLVAVPESTTERAKSLIEAENAELVVHGASWQEANSYALSLIEAGDRFVHPFDDPLIWNGHASLVDEVAQSGLQPDVVVLSVGGGGLLCGVAEGMQRNGWSDVPILAVETAGADSFAQAVDAGKLVELPAITSIATSLGARQVCARALQWTRQHPIRNLVVSDRQAIEGCWRFLEDHRVLVEPSCGASLAAVYESLAGLSSFGTVLVIVCGGVTTTLDLLQGWRN